MRQRLKTVWRYLRGLAVLDVLIAVLVLAAMGAVMTVLVSTNQDLRTHQLYADQAFASAQAGMEVTLGWIYNNGNPCASLDRNLSGDTLAGNSIVVDRSNNRIYVTGTKGDSSTSVSIVDPSPLTGGTTLLVDTSQAKDASNGAPPKKLIGVTFQLAPGCGTPVTIVSMVITWSPNYGEKVQQIKLDDGNIYSSGGNHGVASGVLIDTTDVTIADASVHTMDFIRWDEEIQNRLYTIQFNYADGSNKIVTVDTR